MLVDIDRSAKEEEKHINRKATTHKYMMTRCYAIRLLGVVHATKQRIITFLAKLVTVDSDSIHANGTISQRCLRCLSVRKVHERVVVVSIRGGELERA